MENERFKALWKEQTIEEIGNILRITAHWMAIPLFSLFWIADILYVPHLKWQFLAIRALIIPLCFIVTYLTKKIKKFTPIQWVASIYAISLSFGINLMIFLIEDPTTSYYAGLNLVAIGCLSFIPFTRAFYAFTAAGIYLPYYLILFSKNPTLQEWKLILINSFFIFSSICMCFLIRFFHEKARLQEVEAKETLKSELVNREEIIRSKTEEAIRLNILYSQFSPQIVESIKVGRLKLEAGGHRAQICSIFIDIVNSTERVTRIDKDKVDKVLSKFLDDTIKILLKYDITIDKFLGDGLLGFCNAPLPRQDFVSRVVKAAIEVRAQLKSEEDFFERYWQAPLEIRVGIAKGYVNVGFYGSQKYFRSYTAIGPVVNLASRLCSSADPNQIVVDADVYDVIKNDFKVKSLGKKALKGFENDVIFAYEVNSFNAEMDQSLLGVNDCNTCGGILSLETDSRGLLNFICKSCEAESLNSGVTAATSPINKLKIVA